MPIDSLPVFCQLIDVRRRHACIELLYDHAVHLINVCVLLHQVKVKHLEEEGSRVLCVHTKNITVTVIISFQYPRIILYRDGETKATAPGNLEGQLHITFGKYARQSSCHLDGKSEVRYTTHLVARWSCCQGKGLKT